MIRRILASWPLVLLYCLLASAIASKIAHGQATPTTSITTARFLLLNGYSVPGRTVTLAGTPAIGTANGGPLFVANHTTLDLGGATIISNYFYTAPSEAVFGYIAHGPIAIMPQLGKERLFAASPGCLWCNPAGNLQPVIGKDSQERVPSQLADLSHPRRDNYTLEIPVTITADGVTIKNGTIRNVAIGAYCIIDVRYARNVLIQNITGNGLILLTGCEDCTVDTCNVQNIQLNSCYAVTVKNCKTVAELAVEEDTKNCMFSMCEADHFSSNDLTCTGNTIERCTFHDASKNGSIIFQGGEDCHLIANRCDTFIGMALGTKNNVMVANAAAGGYADVNGGATGNRVTTIGANP